MLSNLIGRLGETLSRAAVQEPTIVLTAAMAFRRAQSIVEVTLELDGEPSGAASWRAPYASFSTQSGFAMSEALQQQVGDWLAQRDQPLPRGVVWLRLLRPYGFLGLVPWEAGMGAVLDRPVLRLPDFPARAAERTDVLENVIVVDPPNQPELATEVRFRLEALLSAILDGSSRGDTRVHVFCSARWHPLLASERTGDRVHFHAPKLDEAASTGMKAGLSAWTDWILERMAGRGIDAVHLIGRAALGDAEGCYLMSCTPFEARGVVPDVEVDLEGLGLLLSRAGAWSVSFLPATAEFRDSVAWVADGIAHRWPGAVLFNAGTDSDSLQVAAKLLYTVSATTAPRFHDGFLYCHPSFISRKHKQLAAAIAPILAEQAALLAARAPATERALSWVTRVVPGISQIHQSAPPNWLGATQRFLESEVFDGLRRGARDVMLSEHATTRAELPQKVEFNRGTEHVLQEMRSVVERYLKDGREENEDDRPISDSRDSTL
jgi:hypothetical protein